MKRNLLQTEKYMIFQIWVRCNTWGCCRAEWKYNPGEILQQIKMDKNLNSIYLIKLCWGPYFILTWRDYMGTSLQKLYSLWQEGGRRSVQMCKSATLTSIPCGIPSACMLWTSPNWAQWFLTTLLDSQRPASKSQCIGDVMLSIIHNF